jgi:hypothetical protein
MFRTVIVVTASVKEDEREKAKVTFLQAWCISLPWFDEG